MIEIALNTIGMISFWLAVEYALKHQSAEHIDEARLMPFADDPEVARRVQLETGLPVNTIAPETMKSGAGRLRV